MSTAGTKSSFFNNTKTKLDSLDVARLTKERNTRSCFGTSVFIFNQNFGMGGIKPARLDESATSAVPSSQLVESDTNCGSDEDIKNQNNMKQKQDGWLPPAIFPLSHLAE